MSGGSYDYAFCRLEEFASNLRLDGNCSASSPAMRQAFKKHLDLVARAMKAIEWNDSCDGDDQESALLQEILAPKSIDIELRKNLLQAAQAVMGALETK